MSVPVLFGGAAHTTVGLSPQSELAMPSPAEIDEAVMAAVRKHWLKVARVNGDVLTRMRESGIEVDAEAIAARIEALIEEGNLQCQGNPKRWRHSEVRLPHEGPERLHYVATVAVAFPALFPEGPDEFDLYEMDILFESDSPEQALKDAIAISKKSPTWRGLEYPEPAALHAVRYIRPRYPRYTLPSWHDPQEWFHVRVAKIDRESLEALRAGDDIELGYGFVHVDGQ
ncbi:MAG TPA: DUF3658 domain-containing protein [Blastocatellia bacterium]|nr:DUF3658 domain-containing protein [Blastocatellia bacterium]